MSARRKTRTPRRRAKFGAPAQTAARSQPSADFADELMRLRLEEIQHEGRNAFLLALAAWQRGLRVTFHYEMASHCARFAHLPFSGHRGEFLTVSDGRRRYTFYRVLSDRTSREASATCESKPDTKVAMKQAGIDVPAGLVIDPSQLAAAEGFLTARPNGRFLLKPVAGTLGRGVLRNLGNAETRAKLKALDQPMLLEEFLTGTEFRVYATGDRIVKVLLRRPASVEGDGSRTVRQLVARKAALRRAHPIYRNDPLVLDGAAEAFLAARGYGVDQVPAAGERVYLSDIPGTQYGGDFVDGLAQFPEVAADIARRATAALKLAHAGIDLLVVEGVRQERPRVVVFEVNQNPYIDHEPLPFPGVYTGGTNRIAESIIDHYFPQSVNQTRHRRGTFDFNTVCRMLRTGAVGEVTLPVLGQGWVHRRAIIPALGVEQSFIDQIHHARLRLGIHLQLVRSKTSDIVVDGVAPEARWAAFDEQVPDPGLRWVKQNCETASPKTA